MYHGGEWAVEDGGVKLLMFGCLPRSASRVQKIISMFPLGARASCGDGGAARTFLETGLLTPSLLTRN